MRRSGSLGVALAVALCAIPATAQYSLPRGNLSRTGRVETPVSAAEAPSPLWRSFVGGSLDSGSPVYLDAGADGSTDLALLAGGVLTAKRPNDITSWIANTVDLRSLIGVFDLDGNGASEIVALGGGGRVVVVSESTGEVLFDHAVVPAIGLGVRVRDLDANGLPDIYVPAAGCGNGGTNEGVALSFAAGIAEPRELWRLEAIERDYYCGHFDVFADVDGDGAVELVVLGTRHFYAFDAATGQYRFGSDDLGVMPFGLARCTPTDSDDDGADELVCVSDSDYAPPNNARRVFAVDFDSDAESLVLSWSVAVVDQIVDRNAFAAESVSDLDADGLAEVVHSFYEDATRTWTTYVRSSASGAVLASWPGGKLAGLVDLDGDGRLEILVESETQLEALRYAGGLESLWGLDGLALTRVTTRAGIATRGLLDRPAVFASSDGPALLLQEGAPTEGASSLQAFGLSVVEPFAIGTYDAPADAVFTRVAVLDGSPDPAAVLAAATSEARLITLDAQLGPTNRVEDPEFPVLGMRHGGLPASAVGRLQAFPLAFDGDEDGAAELVLGDSRGTLTLVDARRASMTVEPTNIWSAARGGYAAFFDSPGPGSGTVVQTGTTLRAFAPTGDVLWDADLPSADPEDQFSQDLLPYPLPGGGEAIWVNRARRGTPVIEGIAVSGIDGSPLWPDWIPLGFSGDRPRPAAWADLDADGVGEIITGPVGSTLSAYDAANGSLVRNRGGVLVALPVVVDLDDDGQPEVLGTGEATLSAVDGSFEPLWTIAGEIGLYNAGAVAQCASPAWVTGTSSGPELRVYDLTTGSLISTTALAAGRQFADPEAARSAGVASGSLHGVTVAPSLEDPAIDVALVGSSDGYLYAVDACDLSLTWALHMGASVHQAVPADTAGNGRPVIVAAVGDGYVYGLGIPELLPPGPVMDTDPPHGISDRDVDEIETFDTLYAHWDGPLDAQYEVSVVTADLTPVTDGFVPVGAVNDTAIAGLDLRLGVTYLVAVRSRDDDRLSPESVSDGVLVVDRTPPDLVVTADPDSVEAGIEDASLLAVRANDSRSLDHVSVEIRAPDGTPLETLLDEVVTGTEFEWTGPWDTFSEDGAPLEPGRYEVVARATDAAGMEATASAFIDVIERSPSWRVRGGGCTCEIAGSSGLGVTATLAWPLALLALWQRSRRRRRAQPHTR